MDRDFADQFGDATVIGTYHRSGGPDVVVAYLNAGTDLSPIQPGFTPPNLRFEIDDCCSKWTYGENTFDFIHIRCLYGSVADWPAFYQECFKYALNSVVQDGIFNDMDLGT